ncbi:MAG: hypothetical protein MJ117_09405, partial [Lachnospiraceae bacterium]|nr:hypothetical protein [Lachnospiraceae bacterium]
ILSNFSSHTAFFPMEMIFCGTLFNFFISYSASPYGDDFLHQSALTIDPVIREKSVIFVYKKRTARNYRIGWKNL